MRKNNVIWYFYGRGGIYYTIKLSYVRVLHSDMVRPHGPGYWEGAEEMIIYSQV